VWLVMHIPVGINDYNTVKEAGSGPVEFWLPGYLTQFIKLVEKFRNTIQMVFSGHTHMDDFRVIEAERTGLAVNKLVPSISPIFRTIPGSRFIAMIGRAGPFATTAPTIFRIYRQLESPLSLSR
jgi:sphingomyelin phosphodiesterase acid-like 3